MLSGIPELGTKKVISPLISRLNNQCYIIRVGRGKRTLERGKFLKKKIEMNRSRKEMEGCKRIKGLEKKTEGR